MKKFRRSSAVEQLTVNQLVVGSIPTAGAKNDTLTASARLFLCLSECAIQPARFTVYVLKSRSPPTIFAKKMGRECDPRL